MSDEAGGTTAILKQLSHSVGGAFRFGTGVMGKSAVLMFFLLFVLGVAIWRLQVTKAIVGIAVLAVGAFFVWLFAILHHTHRHPDTALLEGAEWTAWKKFEATAKSVTNTPSFPVTADPVAPPLLPEATSEEPDQ